MAAAGQFGDTAGVMATRYSLFLISVGTPTCMVAPY